MKEVLGSLPEVITAYKNYNLLVPTATDVQLNPFYKFHVEEVPVDLGETSGDIFKVGSVKTGKQDERGKDIWEDVFSLSKPLLNKMAMAAGIQFNPKETYGERIDRVTYRAQAQGAMRKADGTARTETDQKVICLEDEEEKYRIEFADKAAKGITDEKQAQAAAEIFSGQWVESKNKWGKKCQAFVVAKEDRDRYIDRSVMVNMALLKKTWAEKAMTGAKLRVIRALLGVKGTYTKAELQKNFAIPTVIFSPDFSDPQVRQAMLTQGMNSVNNMFGTPQIAVKSVDFESESTVFTQDDLDNPAYASDTESEDDYPPMQEPDIAPEPKPEPEPDRSADFQCSRCGEIINEKRTLDSYNEDSDRYQRIITKSKLRNEQIDSQISLLSSSVPTDLEYRLEELNRKKEELDSQQEKRYRASVADHELQQIRSSYSQQISDAKNKRDYHQTRLREIKQQEEFMKNSGCPDIENASCRFLAKAVDDVKNLPVERDCLQKFEKEIETLTSEMNKKVAEKQKKIWEIGYNPDQLKLLLIQVNGLAKYERIKKDAEQNKLEIARLEAEKESNDKNIGQCEENLLQVKSKASEITETVNELSESVDRQEQIKQQMAHLQTYVEQEKELPVYEERKQHVLERIESMEKEMEKLTDRKFVLSSQLTGMDTMIEKMKETFSTDMVEETDRQIRSNKETLGELQIQKGVLLERLENIDTMRDEISMLNNGIAVAAGRADCYEALKQAFSQDGVPHQIIRNIIPHITDTTNNILGQMTGGTMGVEFVMERTVKGKDGDKATLDVLINEYGKTTLPYASKSGGEKVKASLAVILALSEIKATAAGIQLGMLFIDEPPFLDDEGAQAYVDALETIRDRYSDVKIMAITHDDAMKARFGQAVTVIKTDDGSKVIY